MSQHPFEAVIGLEIHTELNTKSKLFSGAPNHFGCEPNTNISVVCTGQPGALPVLNRAVVAKAISFGCAIGGEISLLSRFDRKSYFYPDSPRNFQITQFSDPIVRGGKIEVALDEGVKVFEIDRAHIEDDAGMLRHFPGFTGVDYNRAGVPLIEIVSTPCMHSPKQAVAYAMQIKAILEYLDVSDCNMEEGSLRMDANVSVRLKGEEGLRPKIEIKNMNSFSNMEKALEEAIWMQIKLYQDHPDTPYEKVVIPSTYRWDTEKNKLVLMRRKETSDDYRYFPEPDLPPIILTEEEVEEIRAALPELPLEREKRYLEKFSLSPSQAFLLVSRRSLGDYFEEVVSKVNNPKLVANWLLVEFPGRLAPLGKEIDGGFITPSMVVELLSSVEKGELTGRQAKEVADEMVLSGKSVKDICNERPELKAMNDSSLLESVVKEVIKENPSVIEDIKNGKEKARSFLVGQIMKKTQGAASPAVVKELLDSHLS